LLPRLEAESGRGFSRGLWYVDRADADQHIAGRRVD
jgi:hypothetical protein